MLTARVKICAIAKAAKVAVESGALIIAGGVQSGVMVIMDEAIAPLSGADVATAKSLACR